MMNKFVFVLIGLLAIKSHANTVFIGDSIAHGYKLASHGAGKTKVGASPSLVFRFLKSSNIKQYDRIVLSTGISNGCHDIKTINDEFDYIELHRKRKSQVIILGNKNCKNGSSYLKRKVNLYGYDYIPVVATKDGIHPKTYNSIDIIFAKP